MLDLSALSQLKDLKNTLHEEKELKTGKVIGSFGRYGFVQNEQDRVFLAPDQMGLTLIGDTIEFSIEENNGKQQAQVESIVSSELKELIGRYVIKGKGHFVEAIDSKINTRIFIPESFRKDCKENDIVQIQISKHPFKSEGNTQAKILNILGNTNTAGIWHEVAKLQNNIISAPQLSDEEKQALQEKYETCIKQRSNDTQDLTHLDFFTIDSASSQDLDDAICLESSDDKQTLYIAIADPAALISNDHNLTKHALKSVTSTYLPGQSIAMLPSFLSNNLLSLLPNQKKLAFILKFEFNQSLDLINSELINGIIESKNKFSYEYIDEQLKNNDSFTSLKALTDYLYSYRKQNEIIMQQTPDFNFELNDDLTLKTIVKKEESPSRKIIEECMVFANKWIAQYLSKNDIGIFISQSGLRPNTLEHVKELLTPLIEDYDHSKITDINYFKFCFNQIEYSDQLCLQKRLERSNISVNDLPHFAMGTQKYCTFTSPIRKANDLIIHQMIHNHLNQSKKIELSNQQLEHINSQVRIARLAANSCENQLRIDSMKIDQIFEARISHATPGNIIFEILENGAQCQFILKKIKSQFDPLKFSHSFKGKNYNLNDIHNIKITKKDSFSSTLECSILNDEK